MERREEEVASRVVDWVRKVVDSGRVKGLGCRVGIRARELRYWRKGRDRM